MTTCPRCSELQAQYDEFQAQSRELESELETELQAAHTAQAAAKAKLEKAHATLAAERESGKQSQSQLHAQITSLQTELAKQTAQIDSLRQSKRTHESYQSDADDRLRRAEAAASDAQERADMFAEQVVLLKGELEEHLQMHVEQEERTKIAMRELQGELARAQRQAAAAGAAAGGATADSGGVVDPSELENLREEVALLGDEKAALMADIEEVTTDLTRAQEENEILLEQIEVLKAGGGEGGEGGSSSGGGGSGESLQADVEQIESLSAQLAEAQAQLEINADAVAQLEAKQAELDAALANLAEAQKAREADAAAAAERAATMQTQHAAALAALEAQLQESQARQTELQAAATAAASSNDSAAAAAAAAQVESLRAELAQARKDAAEEQRAAQERLEQVRAALAAQKTKAKEAEEAAAAARKEAEASQAAQTAQAKSAASSHALLAKELAEARTMAAASADDKESVAAARIAELGHQLQSVQSRLDDSEALQERQAVALRDEAAKLLAAQTALQTAQTKSAAEATRLREEIQTVRIESASKLAALQTELEAARAAAESARKDAEAARAAADAARTSGSSSSAAEAQLAETRAQLASSQAELAALSAKHAEAAAAASSELASVQSQLSVVQILHDDFERAFQESEAKRSELESQLAEAKAQAKTQAQGQFNGTKSSAGGPDDAATELDSSVTTSSPAIMSSPSSSPPSVLALDRLQPAEGAATAQVQELGRALRHTLDGLRTETSKLPPPASQSLEPLVTSLHSEIDTSLTLLGSLQQNLASSTDRELDLMGKLQTLKGTNIRVFCRVRPMLPHELLEAREENLLQYPSEQQVSIRTDVARRNRSKIADMPPGHRGHTHSLPDAEDHSSDYTAPQALASYTPFAFDKVFQPGTSQVEVYEHVEEMILPVLNGYRACIFAFGQTGSGKTYTLGAESDISASLDVPLEDDASHVGITYRSMNTLFRGIANRGASYRYEVRLTLLELYNEQWADLLDGATVGMPVTDADQVDEGAGDDGADEAAPASVVDLDDDPSSSSSSSGKKAKLIVRKGHHGMYVEGASQRVVGNVGEVLTLLAHGYKNRHVETTQLNEASSRSHLLLLVDVVGVCQATQVTSFGRLALVDLAGSERVRNSGVSGARLVEAAHINKSLSALADVFIALADSKAKHVPFRNSKLTHLLQDNFQGSSKTLMFVCCSPSAMHAGETLCSLQFAVRARQVRLNQATAVLDGWGHKYKQLMQQQQTAFATREKNYQTQFKSLKLQVAAKDKSVQQLQSDLKALQEKLSEANQKLDRAESDRLRATAAAAASGPPKDKRLEASEDRKWAALQSELSAAQTRALDAKAQVERVQNEWKNKHAELDAKYKESVEKLRIQRLELADARRGKPASTTFGGTDPTEPSEREDAGANEVAALNRQVALLELEVRRLKLMQRSSLGGGGTLRSPSKIATARAQREASASATQPNAGIEESNEGAASAAETQNGSGSTAAAAPARARTASNAGISPAAARLAALQAQRRAREAQSKGAVTGDDSSDASSRPRSGSLIARRSLLPPSRAIVPSLAAAAARHARTASRESTGSVDRRAASPAVPSPHGLDLAEDARSEDGSEASETASGTPTGATTGPLPSLPLASRRSLIATTRTKQRTLGGTGSSRSGSITSGSLLPPSSSSASSTGTLGRSKPPSGGGAGSASSSGPAAASSSTSSSGASSAPSTSRIGLIKPKAILAKAAPTGAGAVAGGAPAPSASATFTVSATPLPKPAPSPTTDATASDTVAAAPRSMLRPPTNLAFTSAPKK